MEEGSSPQELGDLYPLGKTLRLHSHAPCRPFSRDSYPEPYDDDATYRNAKDLADLTPEDIVYTKASRERDNTSEGPPFAEKYFNVSDQTTLRILDTTATGLGKGSQVVLCEVQRPPSKYWAAMGWHDDKFPTKVIAKIYDPLYYPTRWFLDGRRLDTVSFADKAYAHEAACYIEIHGHRGEYQIIDEMTPNFYGTFSITHTDSKLRSREVRIVLLEYIEGTSMRDLCRIRRRNGQSILVPGKKLKADDMDERLRIFGRMMHGAVSLEKIGIFHHDLDPNNILIANGGEVDSVNRVVIIDFDESPVRRYSKLGPHIAQELSKPLHPVYRYGIRTFAAFGGWIPLEWLAYAGKDMRTSVDVDTDSDFEEDPNGPGRSFTMWAMKHFDEAEFATVEEAGEIALRHDAEEQEAENRKAEEKKAEEQKAEDQKATKTTDQRETEPQST